ncbi:hypothetical protein BDZ94DRAFT_1304029 [Collybia nuda]|uniref:Uncharacterized protein n=1 Tax=Collybia nuda TaxID=64659 RepID=A0A9P6CQQ5_9AGAR|nr:hypothetical protein BDZ94DRAFT_1304029 [Collybia nuda]
MDIRTRSPSLSAPIQMKQEQTPPPQDKISAYYSLVFPHFTFYIQTLSVTIGRRCAPNPNTATSSTAEPVAVDVDLGALKSVSRLHAKIEFDQDEDRFVLAVIGRNGAWVDGVWSASGTRAPLGERSQIQIASRTFLFVLPPPPPPEDTPSPSSQSSNNRARSPSLDITSISPPSSQPSHTPPPPTEHKIAAPPPEPQLASRAISKAEIRSEPTIPPAPSHAPSQPQLPNSNAIGKSNKATSKKRKKGEDFLLSQRPKPDEMPPKPPFTYAQLIYRAIKAIGDKATLQEICSWIMNTHEYYRYADGAWMSSVRHNLSSSRAFQKLERCGGDRGKGFFWTLDEKHSQALEDQEAKAAGSQAGGKDGKGRKRDKGVLEPALKRSIKGDLKGGPLPPPLTSTPLVMKSSSSTSVAPATTNTFAGSISGPSKTVVASSTPAITGVFAYPTHPHQAHMQTISQSTTITPRYSTSAPNPYAALTQSHWGLHSTVQPNLNVSSPTINATSVTPPLASTTAIPVTGPSPLPPQVQPAQAPDVIIPITLGPIPAGHADYSPTHPNNSIKEGYMVLHERTLILDPDVFSGLTKERLTEIEQMGMRAALGLLTTHMVKALKERRAKERGKGRERGARRGRGTGKRGGSVTASSGPFTNTPLDRRPTSATDINNSASPDGTAVAGVVQTKPPTPVVIPVPDPVPMDIGEIGQDNMGSPILIIDDSDDDGPTAKRRKVESTCG